MNQLTQDYINLGEEFVSFVKSIDQNKLNAKPEDGEWSASFAIHHLADFEIHFAARFLRILTEEKPDIQSYDESLYVNNLNYESRNVNDSIKAIDSIRTMIGDVLTKVKESDFQRIGNHSKKGLVKLEDMIGYCNNHIKNHLEQVKKSI